MGKLAIVGTRTTTAESRRTNRKRGKTIMTGINEVARQIHENVVDLGWWDEKLGFPEVLALIHSEVSEALE